MAYESPMVEPEYCLYNLIVVLISFLGTYIANISPFQSVLPEISSKSWLKKLKI